jgi:hypothetical protein
MLPRADPFNERVSIYYEVYIARWEGPYEILTSEIEYELDEPQKEKRGKSKFLGYDCR